MANTANLRPISAVKLVILSTWDDYRRIALVVDQARFTTAPGVNGPAFGVYLKTQKVLVAAALGTRPAEEANPETRYLRPLNLCAIPEAHLRACLDKLVESGYLTKQERLDTMRRRARLWKQATAKITRHAEHTRKRAWANVGKGGAGSIVIDGQLREIAA